PVSSLIVFYLFVLPFLFHIAGDNIECAHFPEIVFNTVPANLAAELKPLKVKTDYVRLRLQRSGNDWIAHPVLGKSASLSTLALADGFCIVPPGEEIVPAGANVRVFLFP
ncbi:MAG TPA: molybdopterin molybdenumtransferase MoeA, partial [Acidobacteriota bacterium]